MKRSKSLGPQSGAASLAPAAAFKASLGARTERRDPLVSGPLAIVAWALLAFLLMRVGLLAALVGRLVSLLLVYVPITSHLTAWYATGALFVLVFLCALCVLATVAATAMRRCRSSGSLPASSREMSRS